MFKQKAEFRADLFELFAVQIRPLQLISTVHLVKAFGGGFETDALRARIVSHDMGTT
jgi:hypothetical protein